MGRIRQATIHEMFHKYKGKRDPGFYSNWGKWNPQGAVSYNKPSLRAHFRTGTTVDLDAPFVVFMGRNGSGKSTFLAKLRMEMAWRGELRRTEKIDYMEVKWKGRKKPYIVAFQMQEQPSGLLTAEDRPHSGVDGEAKRKAAMSSGQYQWDSLKAYLDYVATVDNNHVLILDDPDLHLDPIATDELIDDICGYVKTHENQVLIASQERAWTRVHETHGVEGIVVSLYEKPAKTYPMADFSFDKYRKRKKR